MIGYRGLVKHIRDAVTRRRGDAGQVFLRVYVSGGFLRTPLCLRGTPVSEHFFPYFQSSDNYWQRLCILPSMGRPLRVIQNIYPYHLVCRTNNRTFRFSQCQVIRFPWSKKPPMDFYNPFKIDLLNKKSPASLCLRGFLAFF